MSFARSSRASRFRPRPERKSTASWPGWPGSAANRWRLRSIRNYLETIAELPWNERSDEHLELKEAAAILEADHYALGDVKDRILEFLAVRQLKQEAGRQGGEETARTRQAFHRADGA